MNQYRPQYPRLQRHLAEGNAILFVIADNNKGLAVEVVEEAGLAKQGYRLCLDDLDSGHCTRSLEEHMPGDYNPGVVVVYGGSPEIIELAAKIELDMRYDFYVQPNTSQGVLPSSLDYESILGLELREDRLQFRVYNESASESSGCCFRWPSNMIET